MIATHLGIVDEAQIENMSWVFFEDVLSELGRKLEYDAVVNYGGNGFCSDSWKMITNANPMNVGSHEDGIAKGIAGFLSGVPIKIVNSKGEGSNGHGKIEDIVGDQGK